MYLSDQIECIFRYWYLVDNFQIPLSDNNNFAHNVTMPIYRDMIIFFQWMIKMFLIQFYKQIKYDFKTDFKHSSTQHKYNEFKMNVVKCCENIASLLDIYIYKTRT